MRQPPRIYKPEPEVIEATEIKYKHVKEIQIKVAKNGLRRATFFSKLALRWLPIPIAQADYLIAGGFATQI